jgi:hypothetical protein
MDTKVYLVSGCWCADRRRGGTFTVFISVTNSLLTNPPPPLPFLSHSFPSAKVDAKARWKNIGSKLLNLPVLGSVTNSLPSYSPFLNNFSSESVADPDPGSRIRCFNKSLDPESVSRIIFFRSRIVLTPTKTKTLLLNAQEYRTFHVKLGIRDEKMFGSGIRDEKMAGSGIKHP